MENNSDKPIAVTLYCELFRLWGGFFYKNVGTGFLTSYANQKKALEEAGIPYTEDLTWPSDIFQANSHGPYTFYLAWRMKRSGRKVIFYAHSTVEDLRREFRAIHFFAPLLYWYLSRLYNFADAVVCPSEYTKQLLNGSYNVPPEKTIVISNGVPMEKFIIQPEERENWRRRRGVGEKTIVVSNAAMAVERKGIDTFIAMGRAFPNVKFFWYGKVFHSIFSPAIPLHTDNVVFCGYVPDIREAYGIADIFLFPSYEEQQGIAILEAGAAGLPLITRDIPVYVGWIENGLNCFKASNDSEFQEKLAMLVQSEHFRASLAVAFHAHVAEHHSIAAVGEKLRSLYNKLLTSQS